MLKFTIAVGVFTWAYCFSTRWLGVFTSFLRALRCIPQSAGLWCSSHPWDLRARAAGGGRAARGEVVFGAEGLQWKTLVEQISMERLGVLAMLMFFFKKLFLAFLEGLFAKYFGFFWSKSKVSYKISMSLADLKISEEELGRLVAVGQAGHAEQIPGLLRPLALPGISAAGRHAEHQAILGLFKLLQMTEQRLKRQAVKLGAPKALIEVTGYVQIYSFGSVPSLSSLAVLAQFKRHFPAVQLNIAFDDDVARMPRQMMWSESTRKTRWKNAL